MCENENSRQLIEQMNAYYDARAPWHDQYMSYESSDRMEELLAPVIDVLGGLVTDRNVLELACGTGNWTKVLAKRAAMVTALDKSPRSLEIARTKLAGYTNVFLVQGDAYALEAVTDSYDVVFSADWWSHIPRDMVPSVLESTVRLSKPGSPVVFLDMLFREAFTDEPSRYDSSGNRIFLRRLPDGSEYEVVKNFPDKAALIRTLAPYANDIDYHEFAALERWMVVYSPQVNQRE
ncbi:MAG: class I SAM-dependent methyltransferase [candidate division Zixibacteria bacterium]|nr:class I SAM-dependent methyltransferase [candidate division Zixibacteria bacterium]